MDTTSGASGFHILLWGYSAEVNTSSCGKGVGDPFPFWPSDYPTCCMAIQFNVPTPLHVCSGTPPQGSLVSTTSLPSMDAKFWLQNNKTLLQHCTLGKTKPSDAITEEFIDTIILLVRLKIWHPSNELCSRRSHISNCGAPRASLFLH